MPKPRAKWLGRFVRNPYTGLAVGLILLVSALVEIWQAVPVEASFSLSSRHGVAVYGLFHALQREHSGTSLGRVGRLGIDREDRAGAVAECASPS